MSTNGGFVTFSTPLRTHYFSKYSNEICMSVCVILTRVSLVASAGGATKWVTDVCSSRRLSVSLSVCLSLCLSVCLSLCRVKACSCSRFRASSPSVASSRASFVSFDKCFVKSVQLYKGTKQPSTPGRVGLSVLEHTVIILTVFLCSQRRHQQLQHQRRRPADLRGLRQVMAVDRSVSPALFYYIYNIYLKYYIYIKFDNNLNVENKFLNSVLIQFWNKLFLKFIFL